MMSFATFFKENPLFHYEDLEAYLKSQGYFNPHTLKAALQYHVSKNHLARIRRGYYVVTTHYQPGVHVENDYLLIAGKMTSDAVISYHTAMEFHALAYSVGSTIFFNSNDNISQLVCEYGHYQQVAHPKALKPKDLFLETKSYDRLGMDIRITTIERTLVDSLHRPELSGGWEEIWRSFETLNFLDVERTIDYALKLANATTIAKLGFFLEQHQKQFSLQEKQLNQLEKFKPKSRHYMDKNAKGELKSLSRWNLIVPLTVINKTWEEPYNDTF